MSRLNKIIKKTEYNLKKIDQSYFHLALEKYKTDFYNALDLIGELNPNNKFTIKKISYYNLE